MGARHGACHHTALDDDGTVGKNGGVDILGILPFDVQRLKLVAIPTGLAAKIGIFLLEALLREVDDEAAAFFHNMM